MCTEMSGPTRFGGPVGNEVMELSKLPLVLNWPEEGKPNQKIYIGSFCLGCRKRNVPANKTVCDICGSAIPLVSKKFDQPEQKKGLPEDNVYETLAQIKVEEEQTKLETDDEYLEEMREKYKGFKSAC